MRIVHIIQNEKFSDGYLHFMASQFSDVEQVFFTKPGKYELNRDRAVTLYEIAFTDEISKTSAYRAYLDAADLIIMSGVWPHVDMIKALTAGQYLKKTYFHFWGGDFYNYRCPAGSSQEVLNRRIFFYAFQKARGLLFLIGGEYEKFREITHVSNKNFIVPMPKDPEDKINYAELRGSGSEDKETCNIIVGNSSTVTNHHEDVFRMLLKYKDCGIRVFSPLSYGDETYREKTIAVGKELLGDLFCPVTDYMEKDQYLKFLARMDVGIFFCDRQQALGNIWYLLGLGKKVYVRPGTSMWYQFTKTGYAVFNAEEVQNSGFTEFCRMDEKERQKNISLVERRTANRTKIQKEAWNAVFSQPSQE